MTVLAENAMLGPYRIAGVIGEGGMGTVYRAEDTRLGRAVAIKVLTRATSSDREHVQRFEQEARATGMLNHPNLLTIFDVGNSEGAPFLVSELLEGETLRDRLKRGAVPPRKSVDVGLQIASGLAAAHEKGIIHRDLKPENIFLTKQGRVKILDFGIAKLSPAKGDGPTFQMASTEPGMVLGTVGYMSPEQVRGEVLDQRSDIFAFGTILYEMLTGSRAFKRDSAIETLTAILKEEPAEISETHPNVPGALDRLVRRCLEKDREQRFQSARDLAFNLETLSTFSTPGTLSQTPHPAATPHGGHAEAHGPTAAAQHAAKAVTRTSATPVHPATMRSRAITVAKPRRRVSPALLSILYIVSIAGAAFAGWYFARRLESEAGEVAFRRVTFRRGDISNARFTPDGDTIVYSAAWDGGPAEIYVASRRSPEARPLGIADAHLLAVSKSTELAILLRRDRLDGLGTLARVPLAGGVPREIAENVLQADWSADGSELAIIRLVQNKWRIEFPIGKVRYETPHYIHDLHVSPDGTRVAFIEPHGGENDVAIIASGAPETIARGWSHGATGLAWAADGKSLWLTGTSTSAPPALYEVRLTGESRLVSRVTGSMKLFDISRAGRVLLSNGLWRAAILWQPPGETAERDASWLDWSALSDLSADGRTILFNETREGGGAASSIYIRRTDAPSPVRIGDGYGDALSPDGKWILAHTGARLTLQPTGTGEPRELKVDGSFDLGAAWLPDSRRVVVAGAIPKHGYQLLLVDTLDETVTPISPENIWGGAVRAFALTPNGSYVAGMNAAETIVLYPAGGGEAQPLPGVEKGEVPINWSADGQSLFVYRPTTLPTQVYRVTFPAGTRELWKQFAPTDPAGVYKIAPVFITSDGGAYAYNALRTLTDLYVAEGLR